MQSPPHSSSDARRMPGPASATERLAAIVESSEDAIIAKDLNSIITDWNRGAELMFGYTAAEMIGMSILRLIPPGRRDEETGVLRRIRRGERVDHFETSRQTRDGRRIDVSIRASPIKDAEGRVIGGSIIARDITLLKDREREIARLSRLYAALSHINQAIVWARNREDLFEKVCRCLVEQGGFRLAWIGWHDPATGLLVPMGKWGRGSEELQSDKVYADERPEGRGPSGTAFRQGQPYICNDMLADPTTQPWRDAILVWGIRAGVVLPLRLDGKVCATLSVYADETDVFHEKEIALLKETAGDLSFALDNLAREASRRMAEAAVENERRFSDTMIESMPGIIYFYDQTGSFLRWNRNFETVSGYSGAEIGRMHPLQLFSMDEGVAVGERIAEVFDKGKSSVEASLVSKDGTKTPYFFTGRRVSFEGKDCLVGMGIDLSERKRAERALRELNETLEARIAERTAEVVHALDRAEAADRIKSAFLATMSHELRTPLNSIIGFTGILTQGLAGPLNDEQAKQLGMVRASARHLLALINDVLDISKIEAGQLDVRAEPFDPRALLETVTESVMPLARRKGLTLDARIDPSLGEMTNDRRRTEQILLNLLNNAIKFTDRGGVTLTADLVGDYHPDPDCGPVAALRLRVADTGIGIAPADLPSLFQPFRQIDTGLSRQHEGTGLGLAICRRLAALMGGEIDAESEPGRGSTFTVILPLKRSDTP